MFVSCEHNTDIDALLAFRILELQGSAQKRPPQTPISNTLRAQQKELPQYQLPTKSQPNITAKTKEQSIIVCTTAKTSAVSYMPLVMLWANLLINLYLLLKSCSCTTHMHHSLFRGEANMKENAWFTFKSIVSPYFSTETNEVPQNRLFEMTTTWQVLPRDAWTITSTASCGCLLPIRRSLWYCAILYSVQWLKHDTTQAVWQPPPFAPPVSTQWSPRVSMQSQCITWAYM